VERERRIAVNGIELAYEEHGTGARPLVLVHGFTGFRQDFAPVLADLSRAHGRVLAIDLRGHGSSTHTGDPSGYTLEQLASDLGAALAALDVERCDLLGHSMGGMLVQRVARSHPERIASLVLLSTSAEPLGWIDLALLELGERIGREAGMDKLAAIQRARAAADPARGEADRRLEARWGPERFWAWRESRVRQTDPVALAALGRAMRDAPVWLEEVAQIACPALVLVGALDAEFLEPAARLAAALPDACYVVIPEAGHQPQLEAPEAFLREIAAHLSRVRPR
jgi:pimeloyl-ACP methyl ester carboxylesterase